LLRRIHDLEQTQTRLFVVTVPYPLGHWDTSEYRQRIDCINASARKVARAAPSARILEFYDRLCPRGVCERELPDKRPLRPDGVHFSLAGAEHIARWVFEQMRQAESPNAPTLAAREARGT
jgi:lysophospholipase L1-like esterase